MTSAAWLGALALAQAPAPYRFDHWATDDGLPQNSVVSIVQTRDGYLWLTTFDGLVRFDGVRFTIFDRSNTPGLRSNRFTCLLEDAAGTLWIGSEYGGLARYAGGKFEALTITGDAPHHTVREIQQTAQGEIIVTTNGGSFRWRAGQFERIREAGAFETQINYWGRSGAWWTADERGVHQFKNGDSSGARVDYPVFIARKDLYRFYEDRQGSLWLGTADAGLYQLKDGVITHYGPAGRQRITNPISLPEVSRSLGEDAAGNLWVCGPGLAVYNPRTDQWQQLSQAAGLPTISLRAVLTDREGNVWLGTDDRGLLRVSRRFITTYSKADGLKNDNIYPLFEDSVGNVWLGTDVLSRINNGQVTNYESINGWSLGAPLSFHEDRAGRVWIGCDRGVVVWQNGQFIDYSKLINLPPYLVIHEDAAGNLWFGSDHGLVRWRNNERTVFTMRDGLPNNEIKAIYEDWQGTLWIGTYGGLVRFDGARFSVLDESAGLVSNRVRTISGDEDGTLWIGTYDGGLSRLRDGRFANFTMNNGLFNNGVFRILEDGRGNFWISSNRGIYRVARAQLNDFADGKLAAITSIAYGKQDGMLNTECNGGRQPAGFRARDGKLWFPTQQGAVVIDPEGVPFNAAPPPVLIEEIKIDGRAVDWRAGARLEPGQSSVEINYTGLSLLKSEQVRFKYKLESLDAEWTDAGTRRTAYYAYLPPGDYRFVVRAANSDGVWNEQGQGLSISVIPPFWQTGWFMALATLGLVALVALAYQQRLRRSETARRAQEHFSRQLLASQESERKRIAAELHDSLGQRLIVIKNLALLLLHQPAGEQRTRQQMEEISSETSQAIHEVKEISYNLRPHQLDQLGLTKAIEALVRRIASSSGIPFAVSIAKIDGLFDKEAEINLYRIVQESVSNIIKHAGATAASVEIAHDADGVQLTIEDNGRGFNPNHAPDARRRSFGLLGLAERARMLGGTQIIRSVPGQGTTITIYVGKAGRREGMKREYGTNGNNRTDGTTLP